MEKEWKIGEIKQINGEWYQCVEHKGCHSCAFALSHGIGIRCGFNGDPHCAYRSDGKPVIFKKLEKVGEPYAHNSAIVQKYRIRTTPVIMPNEPYMYFNAINNTIAIEIKQTKEDMEEKKLNLKPFDIQKAREGKPVCTRDGKKARIICFDRKADMPIIALITINESGQEYPAPYDNEGRFSKDESTKDLDLMMLPEKRIGWININKDAGLFKSKEEAERDCTKDYATVRVEFEI